YGLGLDGTPNGIAALALAHEKYAGGGTQVLWVDDGLYVMQRTGFGPAPGLIYVLNNRRDAWHGAWVTTQWRDKDLAPVAWWGTADRSRPENQRPGADGRAQFFAAPRGYAIYAPVG